MSLRSRLTCWTARGLAIAALSLVACGGTTMTSFLHEDADLGAIRSVAVLPFENLSSDRIAGEKVRDIFLLELLSTGAFDVLEPGQVTKVLRESRIESVEALGPEDYQRLGEELQVDGFFLGSVIDFAEKRTGATPTPEVAIHLRLVEALSGVTIWSTGDSRSGSTVARQLVGIGGQSLTEATHELIRQQLDTLFE